MPVDPELRALNIDIPAQPESLVKLSMLLAEEEVNLQQISLLVESDMALASAVLKAVNSSLYGLSGRVQSVHQAITYLGTREVAAVTFEMGLRAVFPGAPELAPVWERAAVRGLLMGALDMPWVWIRGLPIRPVCSKSAARPCFSAMRPRATSRCSLPPSATRN